LSAPIAVTSGSSSCTAAMADDAREEVQTRLQRPARRAPSPRLAGHRRRPRGHQPPGRLRRPLPLRHPLEPCPHGAAQRPDRPHPPAQRHRPLRTTSATASASRTASSPRSSEKSPRIQAELGSLGAVDPRARQRGPRRPRHRRRRRRSDRPRRPTSAAAATPSASDLERPPRSQADPRRDRPRRASCSPAPGTCSTYDSALLRDALDVGLERLAHGPMTPVTRRTAAPPAFLLPRLARLLGHHPRHPTPPAPPRRLALGAAPPHPAAAGRLRPPATMDAARRPPPPPAPLRPARLLACFRAQGHAAHDLSARHRRPRPHGRRSPRARLRPPLRSSAGAPSACTTPLVPVVATWHPTSGPVIGAGDPREDQRALDRLESPLRRSCRLTADRPRPSSAKLLARAPADFAALWPANSKRRPTPAPPRPPQGLTRRGATEAAQLAQLLKAQRAAIQRTLGAPQLLLAGIAPNPSAKPNAASSPKTTTSSAPASPPSTTSSPPNPPISPPLRDPAPPRRARRFGLPLARSDGMTRPMNDTERYFHETWLGLVQPTQGLLVSIPALIDHQCMARAPPGRPGHLARSRARRSQRPSPPPPPQRPPRAPRKAPPPASPPLRPRRSATPSPLAARTRGQTDPTPHPRPPPRPAPQRRAYRRRRPRAHPRRARRPGLPHAPLGPRRAHPRAPRSRPPEHSTGPWHYPPAANSSACCATAAYPSACSRTAANSASSTPPTASPLGSDHLPLRRHGPDPAAGPILDAL
jgi:hypothetical protein